jgi:hypothetical protein
LEDTRYRGLHFIREISVCTIVNSCMHPVWPTAEVNKDPFNFPAASMNGGQQLQKKQQRIKGIKNACDVPVVASEENCKCQVES